MKDELYKYLRTNISTNPNVVDRLVISSFCQINKISVRNNNFVKSFLIEDKNTKESKKLAGLVAVIKKELDTFNIENVIELFEFVISPADRIVNGAVYTPIAIREYIVDQCCLQKQAMIENSRIADISCGCGGFLYNAAKKLKQLTSKKLF